MHVPSDRHIIVALFANLAYYLRELSLHGKLTATEIAWLHAMLRHEDVSAPGGDEADEVYRAITKYITGVPKHGSSIDPQTAPQASNSESDSHRRVLWRPCEPFVANHIEDILQAAPVRIEHPSFGSGFHWSIAVTIQEPTQLVIYPSCSLATIQFVDGALELQKRQYSISRLSQTASEFGIGVAIAAAAVTAQPQQSRQTLVRVYQTGEVDEMHRLMRPAAPLRAPQERTRPTRGRAPRSISVQEAAGIIGCAPSNVIYLLRQGLLPGSKIGRQWFVNAEAAELYKRSNRRARSRSVTAG